MKEYARHIRYVFIHKWFVLLECIKMGIVWQGITHDLSKFFPSELGPYSRMFHGDIKPKRDSTGYYKPYNTGNKEFEMAWLSHVNRNKHHSQYWIISYDEDDKTCENHQKVFDMPERYALEMIADWIGSSKSQKTGHTALEWYEAHKQKLTLSPNTRKFVEKKLKEIFK
jgi:hypothetical protein